MNANVRPNEQIDYSELPAPTDQNSMIGTLPPKGALKVTQPQSNTSQKPGESLLTGQFDEGESHNSFLEALNAFRGKAPPAEEKAGTSKSVRFQGEAAKPA